jgi:hypothetical protein
MPTFAVNADRNYMRTEIAEIFIVTVVYRARITMRSLIRRATDTVVG